MSQVSFRTVKEWVQSHEWDVCSMDEETPWSVIAQTPDEVQITIEEPSVEFVPNVFIQSPKYKVSSLEEYQVVRQKTPEIIDLILTGLAYEKAAVDGNVQHLTDEDAVEELLSNWDGDVSVQFVVSTRTSDLTLEDIGERVYIIETVYSNITQ